MLHICQAGYEGLLERELAELQGGSVAEKGAGWVLEKPGAQRGPKHRASLAFAHVSLVEAVEVRGESVNGLAQNVADFFLGSLRGERIEAAWPNVWDGPGEMVGLGRRVSAVEGAFAELLKRKLARVGKLATTERPRAMGAARGLWVWFVDFGRAYVAREAWLHGARRMADDALAPSRSFLKVEEAYLVLGCEPSAGEAVCDLGAAPGGWSYSAAKRGARVVAVDNGPMKGGARDHARIEHRREDAFKFSPEAGTRFDWLFCDLVEDPRHVLHHIVEPWLNRGWCRRFVVNLKFGRTDPVALLKELKANRVLADRTEGWAVQHLYHDREEFTIVGAVRP